MSARVAVLALQLSITRPHLLRGESTDFTAKVLGLDGVPAGAWEAPYAPDRPGRALVAAAAPGLPLPDGRPGTLLVVLENRSRSLITMDGERDGSIILFIDRASVKNGVFEFKGKVHSLQSGISNIHCTVIPLMAPVALAPAE